MVVEINIDQMREALIKDEVEYIQSLSRDNLFCYLRSTVIDKWSDKYVKLIYYAGIGKLKDE